MKRKNRIYLIVVAKLTVLGVQLCGQVLVSWLLAPGGLAIKTTRLSVLPVPVAVVASNAAALALVPAILRVGDVAIVNLNHTLHASLTNSKDLILITLIIQTNCIF